MKDKIIKGKYEQYHNSIINLFEKGLTFREIAEALIPNSSNSKIEALRKHCQRQVREYYTEEEILKENKTLANKLQRQSDINRIERKAFRDLSRQASLMEDFNSAFEAMLNSPNFKSKPVKTKAVKTKYPNSVLLLQLSDLHANCIVDVPTNKFDFDILSKRLEKLSKRIKYEGNIRGINKLFIACGGDWMSSDRRKDELLTLSTNNAIACIVTTQLIGMFLSDLLNHFKIELGGVTGNESRLDKDLGWSEMVATNNWDMVVYGMLKAKFQDETNISFNKMRANESVHEIKGKNFLIVHGQQLPNKLDQNAISKLVSKYATSKKINIHHTLIGHIHSAYISDTFSRNSSLIGSDSYSDQALSFTSRASQNLHIITDDGLDSFKVDLQNHGDFKGYPISKLLKDYNIPTLSSRVNHFEDKLIVHKSTL